MIDLHSHSLWSDGELLPSELAHRAEAKGLEILGITDHIDSSNMELVVPRLAQVAEDLNKNLRKLKVIPGAELTHIPPAMIFEIAEKARRLGAKIIIVHGETIAETVPAGTNRAALQSNVNILAHPGLITEEEVALAKERGILLEISARAIHGLTNGHVAMLAQKMGANLILNTDSHSSNNFIDIPHARKVTKGCCCDFDQFYANSKALAERVM
ncbi:histidinol phosphate phosphatase domain-containing protein [Candidatus Desantisbacteria bacterium]|nr:histidinol phosphate phosphatase domain-containing protein [Candidatus Desantisbacteria bacterium]